jgi:hypothetical protein
MPPNPAIEPCPHCGSNADVRPSADQRFRCRVCGKARIPIDVRLGAGSGRANALLKESQRARVARIAWQLASVGLGGLGAFVAVLALGASALFDFGWLGNTTMAVFALVPMVIAVLTYSAGKRAKRTSETKLDEAWQTAAARILQRMGGRVEAPALARSLGIDVDYATQLLAEAEVQQLLAHELEDDPVRLRVADDAAALEEAEQALGNLPTQAMRARKE